MNGTNGSADPRVDARRCIGASARSEEYELQKISSPTLVEALTSPIASANIKRERGGTVTEDARM